MRISDWSSDVCSSDLGTLGGVTGGLAADVAVVLAQENGAPALALVDLSGIERIRSEEHTSELQSLMRISYAVFCLKKKNNDCTTTITRTRIRKNHTTQFSMYNIQGTYIIENKII